MSFMIAGTGMVLSPARSNFTVVGAASSSQSSNPGFRGLPFLEKPNSLDLDEHMHLYVADAPIIPAAITPNMWGLVAMKNLSENPRAYPVP